MAVNFRPHYRRIDDLTDNLLAMIDPEGYELPERVRQFASARSSSSSWSWLGSSMTPGWTVRS